MTTLREKCEEQAEEFRVYCDGCMASGRCDAGAPLLECCNEVFATPARIADAIEAVAREFMERALRAAMDPPARLFNEPDNVQAIARYEQRITAAIDAAARGTE